MSFWQRVFRKGESPQEAPDSAFREALLRLLDRDLASAEEALVRAAQEDSSDVDAFLALAALYRTRGEIGRAIRIHQNLLLRSDLGAVSRDAALSGLAMDFQRGGFLQRAIAAFEELLERNPRHEAALRALGELHGDARDWKRALEMCRRLAKVTGEEARVDEAALYVRAANAAQAEGRTDDARRDLKKALRRDPDHVDAWIALGALEAERGKDKRALAAWAKVPSIDRRAGPRVYPQLESSFAAVGRPREFETFLRKLLDERPGDAAARLALVHCLLTRGDAALAETEARALLERDPASLAGQGALLRALLGKGETEAALKQATELLQALGQAGLLDHREALL